MEPFRYHMYVCTQDKPDGIPCCHKDGAAEIVEALKRELEANFLTDSVQVTTCGCLGLCERGPNMVVYPEGTWYTELKIAEIPRIVKGHFLNEPLASDLALQDPDTARQEIIAHNRKVAGMKAVMTKAGVLPEELNRYLRGFMESRLVLTAVELDLFSAVRNGATSAAVARTIGADARATESLMNALAAIELLEKEGDNFRNSQLTADYLVAGAVHDSITATMHAVNLWHRWSTLTDAVKAGTRVAEDSGDDGEQTKAFIAAMHKNASFRAQMIVSQIDLEGVKHVLDLGGGSGAYTIAFLQNKPDIKATLFDVPAVIPLSKGYVAEANLSSRVRFMEGDMISDAFGDGYDLVWISAICHMWGDDDNRELIRRIYASLNPGGRIVLQDFILEDDKTAPRFGAIFALNMLVNTRAGSSYSGAEYQSWMTAAGFREVAIKPLPGPTDLIIGVK